MNPYREGYFEINDKKVEELTKELDKKYGDTVLSPDGCKSNEEYEPLCKHNTHAKLNQAARREQERFDKPLLIERFINFIRKQKQH